MKIKNKGTMLQTILTTGAAAALAAVLLSMLAAFLVVKEMLPQKTVEFAAPIITAAAVFSCCLFAIKRHSESKILIALGASAVYFVIMIIAKLAFFPGSTVHMLTNGIVCIAAAILSFVISGLFKNKRRYKKARRR